jgi:hypothetical protein
MGGVTPISHIGEKTRPAQRRRLIWSDKLAAQLRFVGWVTSDGKPDARRLHAAVVAAGGKASRQAVQQWLAGSTAPTPENQAVVARVLHTAPHLLFPVEAA